MEPSYWLERFPPLAGFEPGTATAAGQGFTYWVTGLPNLWSLCPYRFKSESTDCTSCRMFFFFFMTFFFSPNFHFYANLSSMMLKDAYGWHSQGRLKLASISVQTDHSLPSLPKCRVKSKIYLSPLHWKIFILSCSCTGWPENNMLFWCASVHVFTYLNIQTKWKKKIGIAWKRP